MTTKARQDGRGPLGQTWRFRLPEGRTPVRPHLCKIPKFEQLQERRPVDDSSRAQNCSFDDIWVVRGVAVRQQSAPPGDRPNRPVRPAD